MRASTSGFQSPTYGAGTSGINRGGLVVVLCGLLCMIGAITLNANASSGNLGPATRLRPALSTSIARKTPVKSRPLTNQARPTSHQTFQNTANPLDYPVFYGNTHLPEIALTFDDGPNPISTSQILAILQRYEIKATFFDTGYLVKDFPNIVRQEFLQGHSIGDHSWSHPQLTNLSAAGILSQLVSTSNAIQSVTGVRPTIFRPPYGSFNRTVVAQAFQQNLTTIVWNNDARDWASPGVNTIVSRVLNEAHNGGIILLHDGGGYRYQTVEALPIIITALKQRGYTFVTIPQLLQDMPSSGKPSPSPSPPATDASSFSTFLAVALIIWKQD